jgi:DHA1 family multidrug resistance protein-like MFS transporter
LTSLLSAAVGFVLMVQAKTFAAVMFTCSFYMGSNALLRPSISSLISKRATGGQGQAMGLSNSFMSLGRIMGPTFAGFLFDIDMSYPYLSGAVVMLIGFFATLVWIDRR